MIKAVIFDVDGVIVDSKAANVVFFKNLLQKAGYPKPTEEAILNNFHLPMWHSIEILTKSTDQDEIKRIWELGHDQTLRPTNLLKFPKKMNETIEVLHKNYKLAIVTSRLRVSMEGLFMASNISHFFNEVITFEDCENSKPHPEPLILAAKRLKILPRHAIYIGDSHTDIEAAKAAGMKSIHFSKSKHHDADINITSFSDIVEAVFKLDN